MTNNAVAGSSRSTVAPRFGIGRLAATTPARPSPLRQSYHADSSSPGSPGDSVNGTPGTPQTKGGAIMADIISKSTPTKPQVRTRGFVLVNELS